MSGRILQWVLCFLFALILTTYAQVTMTGGKGMLRLYEAETVTAGHFYLNPFGTFFARQMADSTLLIKDYTINLGLTLGLSRMFESFIHLTLYQTDPQHLWGALGDSKIGLKMNFPKSGVSQFGFLAFIDFPTGRVHPIPYEPYSENAIGYTLIGLASFNFRNAVSPLPLKVTLNVGYKSHNSSKGFFTGDVDQLLGGFGLKFPVKSSQLYTEITGEVFINNDDVQFKQNSLRWSGGYKFLGVSGLIFDVAADIELWDYRPSEFEENQIPRFFADYADWKIVLGLTYRWTMFKDWDKEVQLMKEEEEKKDKESEEIRKQRENVIEELQEYQKRLEDEKKKTVPF